MKQPNSAQAFLPRNQIFRYVDRDPVAGVPELQELHDRRLDELQEQINRMSAQLENKFSMERMSDTRHNLATNTGFRNVTAGVPTGWTSAGAGVTFSQQTVRPGGNTSNYSARIATGAGAAGTLTQTVPVFPGRKMSLSCFVKVTSGSGYIQISTNGTGTPINRVSFTATDSGTAGFFALPSVKKGGPVIEIPSDATTVTITLCANVSSTIDFCEPQYGHGTKRVPALWVANEADALPAGGVVTSSSGTYSPTLTNVANLDSTNNTVCQYLRVGNTVTVSGSFAANATLAATQTQFRMSLPVASNISIAAQAGGVAFCPNIAGMGAAIYGVGATDDVMVEWVSSDINNNNWFFSFTYQVI